MLKLLDRAWRTVATGMAFACFGLGGLLMRLVFFPLLQLIIQHEARKARIARLCVHYCFKGFIQLMHVLGLIRYHITGIEKLHRSGLLILANHPTLIDVVFLIAMVRNANCVVKSSLTRNPFTRGPVRATQYICNDSGNALIDQCIATIQSGNNLIIFPEGTRTPLNGNMKLQRGAANIALRGHYNITPVTIRCAPLGLSKGHAWWKVAHCRLNFTITVEDDIDIAPFIEQTQGELALAARQLTQYLHHYFSVEALPHAST